MEHTPLIHISKEALPAIHNISEVWGTDTFPFNQSNDCVNACSDGHRLKIHVKQLFKRVGGNDVSQSQSSPHYTSLQLLQFVLRTAV
jgi:hypothetical protein